MEIPVVDFSVYELKKTSVSVDNLEKLSEELRRAFIEVGFVYLKNTGINQDEVDKVMGVSKKFFCLPESMKKPFCRGSFSCNGNHGWISVETESLNPQRPGDLKEAFNTASLCSDINWPSEGVDDFRDVQVSFFLRCKELSLRVLRLMALGLGLEAEVFLSAHKHIGSDVNGTTLRSLYYPPVNSRCVKGNQLRCGEHSDYGSITLVFQSPEGGLQVLNRAGEYISAPSIPGTVLINIADLMQRWTSDVYVSAVHRVLLPPAGDSGTRQSLAFFVQPDDEAIISCCDGSDKYPPVKSVDYLLSRFKDSYGKKQISI
ncbi:2-oxoglutarate-dependent dioxygenase htyE-like isoform X2 [Cyprinus carpio]|uniref:2-oxoglutarate-dependent dioxygenase htyE-like isoform X2 n=1 Tax=Cyprinus carpio TaxID=7962 RepID=A0A8C1CMF5_CYPCA|nr:2-oxoglutarate-dependent dioxygenase htyE-like isoform X2 [Cyprinus carpio]